MATTITTHLGTGRVLVVGCGNLAADLCALGVDARSDDGAAAVRAAQSARTDAVDVVVLDGASEGILPVLAQAFPSVLTLVLDPQASAVRVSAWRGPTQDSPVIRVPERAAPADLLRWLRAAASRRLPTSPPQQP